MNLQARTKRIIMIVLGIVAAIIVYSLTSSVSCESVSNKIEVLSEPEMITGHSGNQLTPIVKAEVKNKSRETISVQLKCSIYNSDGSLTCRISSFSVELAPGDTAWLRAYSTQSYTLFAYPKECASFGNVEYVLL